MYMQQIKASLLLFFLYVVPGGGGVWALSPRHVPLESACFACAVHVLLASSVCSADLHLFQHPRPARFQGEIAFPFSHQVSGG